MTPVVVSRTATPDDSPCAAAHDAAARTGAAYRGGPVAPAGPTTANALMTRTAARATLMLRANAIPLNLDRYPGIAVTQRRGRSSMVEPQSSKLITRVRFSSPAQ